MFKIGLLTSTAMTAVTLLLFPAVHAASAQTDMHAASRDPNLRFLCTYGKFRVSAVSWVSDSYSNIIYSDWEHVAVPVTGRGQTVSRIRVIEEQDNRTSTSAFTIGIYSNTASGLPGEPIAVGTGTIGPICGPVKVSIPPTRLNPKTRYWIEETVQNAGLNKPTILYWEADPKTKRKAYVQYQYAGSSSASPWTEQTKGPYVRLK